MQGTGSDRGSKHICGVSCLDCAGVDGSAASRKTGGGGLEAESKEETRAKLEGDAAEEEEVEYAEPSAGDDVEGGEQDDDDAKTQPEKSMPEGREVGIGSPKSVNISTNDVDGAIVEMFLFLAVSADGCMSMYRGDSKSSILMDGGLNCGIVCKILRDGDIERISEQSLCDLRLAASFFVWIVSPDACAAASLR